MKARWLVLPAIVALLTGGVYLFAAEATTPCALTDTFSPVTPPTVVLPIINHIHCFLNLLRARTLATPEGEVVVSSRVPVHAGQRIAWTLATTFPLNGTEAVLANILDTNAPPRLEVLGWSMATSGDGGGGSTIRVWVWNHDPDNDRIGRLTVHIVKP